ncbi:PAS fold-3 [Rhabdaerophilaceae bacterium]
MTGTNPTDHETRPDEWPWLVDDDSLSLGFTLTQLLVATEAPASLTASWFLARLHSDDKDRHLTEIWRHLKGAEFFACASRIRNVLGQDCWIYLEGRATLNPASRGVRVDGF